MIQQMLEQHFELGADVDVNYIWFHRLLSMAYIHKSISMFYYHTIYVKILLISDPLNLCKFNSFKNGFECAI